MRMLRVLAGLALFSGAAAAPAGPDVERVALRVAGALDGVLRACPASFAAVGTADKRCVGLGGAVEAARTRLGAALKADLYGVWRSRDGQRTVYNWVDSTGGYVYLRLQPDPDGRAQTLAYLDVPPTGSAPARTPSSVTLTPARPAETPARAPAPTSPAVARPTTPAPAPEPRAATAPPSAALPYRRPLRLQAQRLNGPDVLAVQNRLIALSRPSGGGRGDGWYGPVTAATVSAFQAANGLSATGRVDRATWDALFAPSARTFTPPTR